MNFRLTASTLDFYVDVRLRNFDGRWLAAAEIGGDREIGLGRTARAALSASLAPLGQQASEALLADPQLLAISEQTR